jgi:4-alpha-glucanotransferase
LVHRRFLQTATSSRKTQFERFKEQKGSELSRTSLFQALREHFSKTGAHPPDWHSWPSCYRDPLSSQVREIANDLHDEIEFLNWAQWVADQQLEWVQDTLYGRGLRLGLYRDMAVGCDRSGAETWTAPDSFIPDTCVGAPPDILNPAGQNWGLPPLNPTTLSDNGYAAFVNLVRANMRHSGAIRIDHAMGLQRLFCIPEGGSEGAYIAYPMDDLIGILALESRRNKSMAIGEDLGTVPEGFRARMRQAAVLSYRVLFFEFDAAGELVAPEQYPVLSLAVAGSHDMATVKSWFEETDLRLKHELKLYPSDAEYAAQVSNRARERKAVEQGIARAGLLREANPVRTVHEFLHRTRSMLRVFQLDDLLEQRDPVNIPGTAVEYPNWRRKYSAPIEEMEAAWKLLPNQPRK